MNTLRIYDIGEKRLISEFIRPLFNSRNELEGVGDDCAMLDAPDGQVWLFSTDRVPADLIAFRLGIIDYYGLGRYLACLNISDIAACGGRPLALLLNLGLPNDLAYEDFKALCKGFGKLAEKHGCRVLGGDITYSKEMSISATSIGKTEKIRVLTRRGAQNGDTIFISRALGLTPAAFAYHLRCQKSVLDISQKEILSLNGQFTDIEPLVALGITLSASNYCTSCMDNTDGVGQSLLELSNESKKAFVVGQEEIELPTVVNKIANSLGEDPIRLAFSAGADFSLIGTLRGSWSQTHVSNQFGTDLRVIGHVEDGEGVYLETSVERVPLEFSGWNYFSHVIMPD